MKKNKPLLVKNESSASDSVERTAHSSAGQSQASSSAGLSERSADRSAAQSPVSREVGRIVSQLGGIEGITKTIGSIQSLIQAITPLLPLLGFAPREQKGTRTRKASISPQSKQKVKRKK